MTNAMYERFKAALLSGMNPFPEVEELQLDRRRWGFLCRWFHHPWSTWLRVSGDGEVPYRIRVCARCNLQQTERLVAISLHDGASRPWTGPDDVVRNGETVEVETHTVLGERT